VPWDRNVEQKLMTWSKMRLNVKERGPIIQIDPNVTQHQKSKREMNLINFDD
jgi:hypothetical protein